MIKIILTIGLLCLINLVEGQISISSKIYDATTKESIPFVNIGIKNKKTGTVSRSNGSFNLNISQDKLIDTLTFSFVGYHSLMIPIKHLLSHKPDSIFLEQKTIELTGVTVMANGKWKTKKVGLSRNLPGVYGVVQSYTSTDIVECAQLFNLDSNLTKVSKFHIFLKGVNTDTARFRINFYCFDGTTPTDRAFEKEIFVERNISRGWLEVNLEEYEIWLKGQIISSIEFLPTEEQKEKISLSYGGILVCKETSYNRTSSQGEWNKLDFGTYSIYLTTKKYVIKSK